jgi:hypothetical protein
MSRSRLNWAIRPPTSRARRARRVTAQLAIAAVVVAGSALATALPSAAAPAAPAAAKSPAAPAALPEQTTAPSTLVVKANQPYRAVTHVASGSLYGLDTATVPADSLVAPLHPNTFVQMAPGGSQLPNGEAVPGGDALVVAPEAAKAGAKVVVRMPDWYPNFPYVWVSWANWLSAVDTQVKAVLASSDKNVISAFELWNEPDWTWDTAAAGPFDAGWARTFKEVRADDPSAVIQGPSYSTFNATWMTTFLTDAKASGTLPDIISWHELDGAGSIPGDVAEIETIEKSLGITPRPIAIEEYGEPNQVGVPGDLVGYIANFERSGVNNAELAFWNHYGTLGDLLTDTGASPNGAYWLYDWYGQMTGNMVTVTPPGTPGVGLDGAASVNPAGNQVSVIFGGGSGATAVTVNGLSALRLGNQVNVQLQYTPSAGRTTAVAGPVTISDTTYPVVNGSITVPVAMNPAYGYHLVITPAAAGSTTSLNGSYTITNLNSGLNLDTQNGGTKPGTLVDQAAAGGGSTQTWQLTAADAGLYRIVDKASGLLLGVKGESVANGANEVISGDASTPDQLWQLIPDGDGHYELANYNSGLVLGVTASSTAAGALTIQWPDGQISSGGAAGPRVPGKIGNAVHLNGDGEYISMPNGIVSGLTGDYTVSAWVDPSLNSTWSRVFDFGTGTTDYMFLTISDGTNVRFAITTTGPGGEQQINGTSLLPLNAWSLVTVTVSGTTGTLYVNGTAVGTNPDITITPSELGTTTQDWIGRSEYAADPYLDASLDDFTIYSSALTAAQVATLATGVAGAGNVVDYTFDETGGATVTDSSGNGNNGTITFAQSVLNFGDPTLNDHLWTLTRS